MSNGSATVFFSGGSSPYTYSWNTIPNQTIKQSTGLSAGNYLVTIYDNHGCTASASVTITQPSIVTSASSVLNNVLCGSSNGSATINVSGGTSPYSYFWTTKPSQTNQTATGMTAGNYTITVTDANGCITSNSAIISSPLLYQLLFQLTTMYLVTEVVTVMLPQMFHPVFLLILIHGTPSPSKRTNK